MFSFFISFPLHLPIGTKCQFCIRYRAGDAEHWDNNVGSNYAIECMMVVDDDEQATTDAVIKRETADDAIVRRIARERAERSLRNFYAADDDNCRFY